MQAIRFVVAALMGGALAAALLGPAIAPDVHISARGLNAALLLVALVTAGFVALVLCCDRFSRHVEAWLASFRAGKRAARGAWTQSMGEEARRLNLEVS